MSVTLVPSFKGGASKIGSELGGPLQKAGRAGGQKFGVGMKSGIAGIGSKVFAPLAAAAAAVGIGGFFKDAITGASDLNETTTKVQAIFGKGTEAVQKFASSGAKALGQSRQQVLDASATFGTFGKAAGLGGKDLAKFSTDFAGLSTDMASFSNTSPEQAVQAIGAALRGEAEPIRQYGVLLDDATLRTEALKLGLIKTTKQALTPQQKVLAAQAAIYKQTGDAQGDFNKTSGGLANQQRILAAQFTDMKTNIGGALLPVVVKAVSGFNKLFDMVKTGEGPIGAVAGAVQVFFAALSGQEVTTLGPLGKIGDVAYAIRDAFIAILPSVKAFATQGLSVIGSVAKTVGGFIVGTIIPAVMALLPSLVAFGGSLMSLGGTLLAAFKQIWPPVKELITGIISQLVPGLKAIFAVITTQVVPAVQGFIAAISPLVVWLVGKLAPIVKTVFGVVITVIKNAFKIVAGIFKFVTAVIKGDWSGAWDAYKSIVSAAWGVIKAVVVGAFKILKSLFSTYLQILGAVWGRAWSAVKAVLSKAWDGIKSVVRLGINIVKGQIQLLANIGTTIGGFFQRAVDAVRSKVDALVGFVKSLPGRISGALGNLGSILYDAGRSVISGLLNGIKDAVSGVINFVSGIAGDIRAHKGPPAKDKKLLVGAGKLIIGGLREGLESEYGSITSSLQGLTSDLTVRGGRVSLPTNSGVAGGAGIAGRQYTINYENVYVGSLEELLRKTEAKLSDITSMANIRVGVA